MLLTATQMIHSISTFSVNAAQKVFVKKANVVITTAAQVLTRPLTIQIILLNKPEANLPTCEDKVSPVNFALTETILWLVNEWETTVSTPDISSLIQHAVDVDWYYGKEMSILFLIMDDHIDQNYNLQLNSLDLNIYYEDFEPSKYLNILF